MLSRACIVIFILLPVSIIASSVKDPAPLFIVHFETGSNWDKSLPPAKQTKFREHSANLNRLRSAGIIQFGARYGELGVIIVKAESLAAARSLIESDPGVRSGIFKFQVESLSVFYPWQSK